MEDLLTRSVDEIISKAELQTALTGSKKLRLKLGVDPSSPDIHLGHAVILRKLKQFQDMGHTVIFLIGDATARIGDPSGRNKTRPVLTEAQIQANAQTYLDQVGQILDISKVEVRRNSEWFDQLEYIELLKLTGQFTVAQLIEREDFKRRLDEGLDLGLHELLYPVMQAYDSVMLEADIEFGGIDQRFNMFAGRALQKKLDQRPQQVFMTKLLVGSDGSAKMSKSLGNYIALTDAPEQMFGKIMSIPDHLIAEYYELCTDIELTVIHELIKTLASGANPRDAKASLAREIVTIYHDAAAALTAETAFNRQFRDKELPDDIQTHKIAVEPIALHDLLVETGLAESKTAARLVISQGGVKLNGQVQAEDIEVVPKSGDIVQVGKRNFAKLQLI